MATEKTNLTAPMEPVGTLAEDAQMTTTDVAQTTVNDDAPIIEQPMSETFAEEEAALAADEAGLDIGAETAEEQPKKHRTRGRKRKQK